MIYAGSGLRSAVGSIEPSLIDPNLPISNRRVSPESLSIPYWPVYDRVSPETRTAYLAWLADGRRDTSVPIGIVFLFMYGLERRVLVDIVGNESLLSELPEIRQEMTKLLTRFGPINQSFRGYAAQFINLIDCITLRASGEIPAAPELITEPDFVPISLRVALGRLASSGAPISADLALRWAWYHPENSLRAPAYRCREDLVRLFTLRFNERYPDGLKTKPGRSIVKLTYRPASSGINEKVISLSGVPDTFAQAVSSGKLVELFQQVTDELAPYSRMLGREPMSGGSLAAIATLPRELIPNASLAVNRLQSWLEETLGDRDIITIQTADLLAHWQSTSQGKLPKSEAVALAQLLQALNVGIEPDVRFGGSPISEQMPVTLFRLPGSAPHSPSSSYAAASTLVQLAVAVGAADGELSDQEVESMQQHLETSLSLLPAERQRLHAQAIWLAAGDSKLSALKKRLESFSSEQRVAIGQSMIAIASADGIVSPAEITTLTKIYKLLDLDPSAVTSHLHAVMTQSVPSPARGPVVVRRAGEPEQGYNIPKRPVSPAGSSTGITLDTAVIQQKMQQSSEISSILTSIFTEPEESAPLPSSGPTMKEAPVKQVLGLDSAHSALFIDVTKQAHWSGVDFENLCERHNLMPAGAVDTLNEAAYDVAGEPLLEGDEEIIVNSYAFEEMRK